MLLRGTVEEETHCTGSISEIKLNGNGITSVELMMNKLERLDLTFNNFNLRSCAPLAVLIPNALCSTIPLAQEGLSH